ncbi:MAG: hypothetical protein WBV28_02095 [Terracidiphilus sp.]
METMANAPESVTKAVVRAINRQDVDAIAALLAPARGGNLQPENCWRTRLKAHGAAN